MVLNIGLGFGIYFLAGMGAKPIQFAEPPNFVAQHAAKFNATTLTETQTTHLTQHDRCMELGTRTRTFRGLGRDRYHTSTLQFIEVLSKLPKPCPDIQDIAMQLLSFCPQPRYLYSSSRDAIRRAWG